MKIVVEINGNKKEFEDENYIKGENIIKWLKEDINDDSHDEKRSDIKIHSYLMTSMIDSIINKTPLNITINDIDIEEDEEQFLQMISLNCNSKRLEEKVNELIEYTKEKDSLSFDEFQGILFCTGEDNYRNIILGTDINWTELEGDMGQTYTDEELKIDEIQEVADKLTYWLYTTKQMNQLFNQFEYDCQCSVYSRIEYLIKYLKKVEKSQIKLNKLTDLYKKIDDAECRIGPKVEEKERISIREKMNELVKEDLQNLNPSQDINILIQTLNSITGADRLDGYLDLSSLCDISIDILNDFLDTKEAYGKKGQEYYERRDEIYSLLGV